MSLTHNVTLKWTSGGNEIEHTISKSSGAENNLEEVIPLNSTDLLLAWTLDVSQLKFLYIVATANMTVETNSGAAPGNTLTLVANEPVEWHTGSPITNPLTVDVTALYVTNTTSGTLKIRALIDPTV